MPCCSGFSTGGGHGQDLFSGDNRGCAVDAPGVSISGTRPIRGMGRFPHEARAVDPAMGCISETGDEGDSAFYNQVPNGQRGGLAGRRDFGFLGNFLDLSYEGAAGRLYAMVLDGTPRVGTPESGALQGTVWNLTCNPLRHRG